MNRIAWPLAVLHFCVLVVLAGCEVDPNDGMMNSPVHGSTPPSAAVGGAEGQTGAADGGMVTTATGLPCDVDAVLKERCQTCHGAEPKYGANVPLVTANDLQQAGPGGKKVSDLVMARIRDDARPMPPSPQPRLTEADRSVVDAWVTGGMKPSEASCTGKAPATGVKPLSCKPDTVLKAAKPFTLAPNSPTDQYVCFGVDVDLKKKRHVTALAPKVDNAKIVHHILLFQTSTAERSEPFACEAFGSAAWKLVAGWAPGGDNLELPKEAGFPEESGTTHWVLQVHYNNTTTKTGTDQSGYELCTTEELRPNDAGVLAFGSVAFAIPPRSTHTIRCDYGLGPEFANVKLFNASPHMHTRGVAMSTERLVGGGTPEPIFEQKAFSFEAQANYPISKSVKPGDVLRTRCTWKNPGDKTIGFGEGTDDEMCFDFLGYYPKIPDRTLFGVPLFTWVTPSALASCTTE
jgi:hypothetical protein